jgi:hypothetical protein
MGIDIRLPLGLLFLSLGAILLVYGILSNPDLYYQSLGINVNLYWGLVLLAFGALMFTLRRRDGRGEPQAETTQSSTHSSSH